MKKFKAKKLDLGPEKRIGFETWNLVAVEKFSEAFNEAIKEACKLASETEVWVHMPIIWACISGEDGDGGPPVEDPLTIRVVLPVGPDSDDDPSWTFSLVDLIEKDIIGELDESMIDETAPKVRDALRALADKIDEAIDNEGKSSA